MNMNTTIINIMKRAAAVTLLAVITSAAWAQAQDPIYSDWYGTFAGTAGASGEGRENLIDGDKNTKWCVVGHNFEQNGSIYIEFDTTKPFVPSGYILTTGTDSKQYTGRNPKSWIIRAKKNRADRWETLDTNYLGSDHPTEEIIAFVSGDTKLQDVNSTDYEYKLCTIGNGTEYAPYEITEAYKFFRIDFLETKGSTEFQLSEFQFRGHQLTTDLSTLTSDYTATDNEVLTGTLPSHLKLSIADNAEVTLSGVNIDSSVGPGIDCLGHATLVLANGTTNNVKGAYEYAGIRITDAEMPDDYYGEGFSIMDKSYVLTIKGNGTLNAYGQEGGAGIGSDLRGRCGEINIESGTINAYGSNGGAGIGAGESGHCDEIFIGGTVRAEGGGGGGAGIGSGRALPRMTPSDGQIVQIPDESSCGDIYIKGNVTAIGGAFAPGIGSGATYDENNQSTCGDIKIYRNGTIVTATGNIAPGIGSGYRKSICGDITISNEVTEVKAIKGNSSALYSIGKFDGDFSACGTVTIGGEETGFIPQNPFTYRPGRLMKIIFNANEGTGTMHNMYFSDIDNSTWPLTANTFTRQYYTFGGWNTAADGSGLAYVNQGNIALSTTLYAQWNPINSSMSDGSAYTRTADLDVFSATYTKTLDGERVGKHQAWLVPFDYTINSEDLEKFHFYKINMIANSPSPEVEATDDAVWVFVKRLDAGDVLHGNMPYVYKPLEAVTNYAFTSSKVTLKAKNTGVLAKSETMEDVYSFYATYNNTTATASDPFYYVNMGGGISLGTSVSVGPYRWIIRKTNKYGGTPSYVREMHFVDGEEVAPTGINAHPTLNNEQYSEQWFDLNGSRISGRPSHKGIYIRNGKKVVVK